MAITIPGRAKRRAGKAVRAVAERVVAARPVAELRDRSYRRGVEQHSRALRPLEPVSAGVVAALRQQGVTALPLAALAVAGADEMTADARDLMDRRSRDLRSRAEAGAMFLMVPPTDLLERPSVFRFGLSDQLLDLAEAYLGLPAAYDGVTIQYTPADGRAVSTRDWHRDREDRHMLKLCVYLNDVGPDDGPFELVADADFGASTGFHLDEADVARLAAPDGPPVVTCTGPAGTAVFADTAGYFHRGRPATGRDRAAVFFSYFAQRPSRPYFCERSGLSTAERLALADGLPLRQQAAVDWASALPLPWRLIPAAPI